MVSIVIPLVNEADSLRTLYKEIKKVLRKEEHEILFIDDGSTDDSLNILKNLAKKDKKIHIYSFRRNQGKSEALTLGFRKAKGEYIITLDADLQDKPSQIPRILEELHKGFDVVCGWRKDRKDKIHKKISSKLFNTLATLFWGLHLHDYNSGLKGYASHAACSLRLYGGLHRFIPLLAYEKGFRVTEIAVEHDKRKYGKSKYGFSKLWKDLPDMFTVLFLNRYADRPLHFFGMVGSILFFIGVMILLYLALLHFQGEAIGRRPLLIFGMLSVLGGLQVLFTGFLADLIISVSKKDKMSLTNDYLKYSTEK